MLARALASAALTAALLTGATAAHAGDYTGNGVVPDASAPGAAMRLGFPPSAIAPGTKAYVAITVANAKRGAEKPGKSGKNASTAQPTAVFAADGSVSLDITTPTTARAGDIVMVTVTGDDGVDTYSYTQSITVAGLPADAAAAAAAASEAASPVDGMTLPAFWFGLGALAITATAAGVVGATRRARA